MSQMLKLIALDSEDLTILAAHVQDGVVKAAEIVFDQHSGTLAIPMHRFVWEREANRSWLGKIMARDHERRLAVLNFARVSNVRSQGIEQGNTEQILSILTVAFTESDAPPSGTVLITFAGESALQFEVECIEARLTDIGGAWQAGSRPDHELSSRRDGSSRKTGGGV